MSQPHIPSHVRVALVYDWATTRFGGAEWLMSLLLRTFPQAPLFTTVASPDLPWVTADRLHTTFLQHLPLKNHRFLVPLMPLAIERLDVNDFNIIISVSTGISLGILTKPHQLHICYLLSPPRYVYNFAYSYGSESSWSSRWPFIYAVSAVQKYLRWWQNQACLRPDHIIPLSNKVRLQAEGLYQRQIEKPLYPPLPDFISSSNITEKRHEITLPFWLYVGRLVEYKQAQLCLKAAVTRHHPLVIAGSGPLQKKLVHIAGSQGSQLHSRKELHQWLDSDAFSHRQSLIGFWSDASDADIHYLMSTAAIVLSPGLDDFGLVPLQAVCLGTPVVYHNESGVAEVLEHKQDGVALTKQDIPSLLVAIDQASTLTITKKRSLRLQQRFSSQSFTTSLSSQVAANWYTHTHSYSIG